MGLIVDFGLLALAVVGLFMAVKYELSCPNVIAGLVTFPALVIGGGIGWVFHYLFSTSRYAFFGVMGVSVFFIAFVYSSISSPSV